MKSLVEFITEGISKSNAIQKVNELIKTCSVDPNKEVYVLTRNKEGMYIYKTTSKDDLEELYINTLENSKEYGRYVSFHTDKKECLEIHNKGPFKKLELYDKTGE